VNIAQINFEHTCHCIQYNVIVQCISLYVHNIMIYVIHHTTYDNDNVQYNDIASPSKEQECGATW
jgi:hypothetical protein